MKRFLMLSGAWLLMTSVAFAQNYEAKFLAHQLSNTTPTGPSVSNSSTADFGFAAQPFGGVTFAGTLNVSVSPEVSPVAALVAATNSVMLGAPLQLTVTANFTSTLPQLATGMLDVFQKFTTRVTGEVKVGSQQICVLPLQEITGRPAGTYTFTPTISCTVPALFSSDVSRVPLPSSFDAGMSAFIYYTARAEFGNTYSPSVSVATFYRVTQTGDLSVSVVDPNCESAIVCSARYLEPTGPETMRLITDLNALKGASTKRTGVVADGVTMLLIRATLPESKTPPDAKLHLTLKDSGGGTASNLWGVLMARDGSGGGSTLDVPFELAADGKKYAFALYRAPTDHPATSALKSTSVTIEATTATTAKPDEKVSTSIRLLPPPVVLVHGVWSNHQAWQNFEYLHLVPAGFRVCRGCRPDYGLSEPAPEFDPTLPESKFAIETVIHAIDAARQDARRNDIAVTQVDGIGHSMGGILLRARVVYQFDDYRKNENYRKGDLHKIITAGSPHHGSSLVTWLIDHRCDQFSWAARTFDGKETIEREFLKQGKPMGPAIYGFQNASTALKNIGRTDVPGHAIIGIAPVTSGTEEFLNLIPYWTNNKDAVGNYLTIDAIAGGEGTHDTIVPVPSQRGVFSPGASTEVPGVVHANVGEESRDTDEPESPVVWNRIVELLKAPIGGSEFSAFEAHSPNPAEPLRVPAPCPAGKTGDDAKPAAAATVLPVAGTIVRPGGTIVLTLNASGANPVEGVLFTVGNRNVIVKGTGPSFTYSYRVPDDRAGRLDIFAGTYGQTGENYYGESYVVVTPAEAPTSIVASPDSVRLKDRGQQLQIVVSGTLSAGSEIDVTSSSAGTTYKSASGGTSVISVTPEGLVEAKGNGSDSVIVTHAGKTASVPVTVQFHVRRRVVRR